MARTQEVGAHERIVAATAIAAGWRVGTANLRHFDRIVSLDVLAISQCSEYDAEPSGKSIFGQSATRLESYL